MFRNRNAYLNVISLFFKAKFVIYAKSEVMKLYIYMYI